VDTISLVDEWAEIDMEGCIHCGICHGVCPTEAVKHDSEKLPDRVETNVAKTRGFMDACVEHLGDPQEGQKCLNRMIKHFTLNRAVAEQTLERLQLLKQE
jgi:ferredoxin